MTISAEVLRGHLDYTAWASGLLLDAVGRLSAEELTRDFKTSDRSVLDTLVHVFAADRIWLSRIHENPRTSFVDDTDRDLRVLQGEWPALHEQWKAWAAGLTDNSVNEVLSYKDIKGNPYKRPLWQIVLHVVNHATHHRGQVSGFVRALGHTPPALDLIYYYRTP